MGDQVPVASESTSSRKTSFGSKKSKQLEEEIKKSKASTFKVPDLIIYDYKFKPNDKDNEKVHPILGTVEVRNIHDFDW